MYGGGIRGLVDVAATPELGVGLRGRVELRLKSHAPRCTHYGDL